ncbi:MAG: iron ABC transporter permease, partial [Treponema sp.]|nr:iron ABC transporter permease [Treponema sp.]
MKIKNLVQGLITFFAVVLALAVILAFVIPLLSATLLNGKSSGVKSLSLFSILKITFYTIRIAFFSTLLSFIVGISASFFTARRTFFGRSFLLSLAAIPLCVPPLIIALGFVTVFGISGIANKMLVSVFRISSRPTSFLYSSLGIVIAQGFYNFPLVMKIVSDSWESNSEEEENAARLLGAREFRIFFTITLHKLFPAILASCIPVFLYCFFSFMIVLLFGHVGRSVLEAEIYRAAKITLNYNDVTSLALVETFCALLIVSFYSTIKK